MRSEPIAIVGQSCILPDALSPAALWNNLLAGRSALRNAPAGRWQLPQSLTRDNTQYAERAWSDVGGYVEGFDAELVRAGRPLPESFAGLDPVFSWVLHGVREALRPVGHEGQSERAGLILGNLSFPTPRMVQYAQGVWLDQQGPAFLAGRARALAGCPPTRPENRFMSGLPAIFAARELGLQACAVALDAACSSSLYALKLACDWLCDGKADLMVAGAVNAADRIFLHVGFSALSALSRSGQSRPFHRDADGLVPAEGAAFVALKRLADAVSAGDRILGVIRGVGLSNDGRGRGLLVPSEEGQVRAMRRAYEAAGLLPTDISVVECHATGTPVGDATELHSMSQVFAGQRDLPIGSIKGNLGHPVTVAGMAGLLKLVAAMEAAQLPPMPRVSAPLDALSSTGFRLLEQPEAWPDARPRRAAINAFGFGGNNAHLVLEQYTGRQPAALVQVAAALHVQSPIAIVGLCALAGDDRDVIDFTAQLFELEASAGTRSAVDVALTGLRFPPNDLKSTLPQQALILEAARRATAGLTLSRDHTGVLIGMGTDPEVARYGTRWQLVEWAEAWAQELGAPASSAWLARAQATVEDPLVAAGVLGTMPNVFANRINSQLDLAGPSLSVSAEELSGVTALELALRALRAGEMEAAVVGAVDFSDEIVHRTSLAQLGCHEAVADGAVVLVLKRLADAVRAGERVLAVLSDEAGVGVAQVQRELPRGRGKAHAATGLLQVASAALAVQHGVRMGSADKPLPWFGPRAADVHTHSLFGLHARTRVQGQGAATPLWFDDAPALYVYAGADREGVLAALEADRCADNAADGPARLVIVATPGPQADKRRREARRYLRQGGPLPEAVAFSPAPLTGELAFVFTGAAAAYPGMASQLLLALPMLSEPFTRELAPVPGALSALHRGFDVVEHPLDQLWACSLVCQAHAVLTRQVLQLRPNAVIGYSSGETNQLIATGAWRDHAAMIGESMVSPIFQEQIAGSFRALGQAFAKQGYTGPVEFASYAVGASVERVRAALEGESLVHLTIINSADDCVIGGELAACTRVLAKLAPARALAVPYRLAAHCPELEEVRAPYFALHERDTVDVPGVRFYWNALGTHQAPTRKLAAEMLTQQAVQTLDFPRVIERAYADGVRIFVEHGPRGLCSGWIDRILGERPHLAVPLDVAGRPSLTQLYSALSRLVAAGVTVDFEALRTALKAPLREPTGPTLRLPAHRGPIHLPPLEQDVQTMIPAPPLRPVLQADECSAPSAIRAVAAAPTPRAEPPPLHTATLAPRVAPVSPVAPPSAVAHRVLAQQLQVGAVHREFLTLQAEAQQRFLRLQADRLTSLAVGDVRPATSPVRAPPPPLAAVRAESPTPAGPAGLVVPPRPLASAPGRSSPIAVLATEGPKFTREQLMVHASGAISSIFGAAFAGQDGYHRQVRMPEPPLLLADRVTGIRGAAGSMGNGTIWTETDVREDSWYLHQGRMPGGIMIEAGQADLMLISWLGVDRLNKSERVYRLLGCDLTYHDELPRPGDTLTYDIHVDGHAQQGDIRLFFFHYDCRIKGRLVLSVRNGQAGFFTDDELKASAGVLWDASSAEHRTSGPLDPPFVVCMQRSFDREALRAFSEGRLPDCFGPGFEAAAAHVSTPRIAGGRMLLVHRVSDFQPRGGPWGRGYLRAEMSVSSDDWFFAGHFKNDPCMPGTLMFEGCLQAMAFYLAALGFTLERDGYRFEPVTEQRSTMRCRGQVSTTSKLLVYEVFVEEVSAGAIPVLKADLLCTVDGLKAFHAQRVGLKLVPDWPLETWKQGPVALPARGGGATLELARLGGLRGYVEPKPVAEHDGFAFDYASLLACAWGRPTDAFGAFYARYDSPRRVARLPGPPYHFISRVLQTEGAMGSLKAGAAVEVEYDIPRAVWYFDDNGALTMPFCVLMEAALQPCGWLASYVGSTVAIDSDLMFRNLDGSATLTGEIRPGATCLTTKARLLNVSRSGEMIIESFEVECSLDGTPVYKMSTVFGFFPKQAFENQSGLTVTPDERARLEQPSSYDVDLRSRPARYFEAAPKLASGMLCMLDRVTAYDALGGKQKLGWARAEKTVDPAEWFFKAHFFQDPVQPGSLGIEALCQLLQFVMIERNMMEGVKHPQFEPIALGRAVTWKYRGQVVPKNQTITTELELVEVGLDERGVFALADAYLWVDGKRIYQAKNLGMRIVEGAAPDEGNRLVEPAPESEWTLDPAVDTWLCDHRPTWTLPALPMMSMVDQMVFAAQRHTGRPVARVDDARVHRWLPFPSGAVRLSTAVEQAGDQLLITLSAWRNARDPALSRFEPIASAHVAVQPAEADSPEPWAPLMHGQLQEDPYASAALFHGPSFQLLRALRLDATGASAQLDLSARTMPPGAFDQDVLDAMTHAIPHTGLHRWSADVTPDMVAYPYRIPWLQRYGTLPAAGLARVEARFRGFDGLSRFPITDLQLIIDDRVYVALRLVEILLPRGPIGQAPPRQRRAFLRDRAFVAGVSLSRVQADATTLHVATVKESDWLPGNVASIYRVSDEARLPQCVAIKDHVAAQAHTHPSFVEPSAELTHAVVPSHPLLRYPVELSHVGDEIRVLSPRDPWLDLSRVRAYWREHFAIGAWPVEDLHCGLLEAFVKDVVIVDPEAFARMRGKSALYLANHQVGIESLMFSVLIPALSASLTTTLAKAEHRTSWLGNLIKKSFCYPGVNDPEIIAFFERDDQAALPESLAHLAGQMKLGRSAMIHVEGTRSLSCRDPVLKMSSAVIDLALVVGCPIVPVRFTGGLPVEPLSERLEFPVGYGKQTIWVGSPLAPKELSALPLKARKQTVIDAINGLAMRHADERAAAPNPELRQRVSEQRAQRGIREEDAALLSVLEACQPESRLTLQLLKAASSGVVDFGADVESAWLTDLARSLLGTRPTK